MAKTSIEWTERNWNPFYGCRRVSPGCENCYAEQMASRFIGIDKKGRTLPYTGIAVKVKGQGRWTGEIKLNERILTEPLRIKTPTKFFVNSMSDTFYEKMPDEWLDKVFAVMALCPQHTFQVLTKRPERMRDYFKDVDWRGDMIGDAAAQFDDSFTEAGGWNINLEEPLPNVWLGVSVENQKAADERIPLLLDTPAVIRWLSVEPLLEAVSFRWANWFDYYKPGWRERGEIQNHLDGLRLLDWVVVGGESGPGAREFNVDWIREIVRQCKEASVPVFVKQMGGNVWDRNDAGFEGDDWTSWPMDTETDDWHLDPARQYQGAECRVLLRNKKGGDITEFPLDLQIREFPKA